MAIVAADIQTRYSTRSGALGNSLSQLDPNLSLGKYVSQTSWLGASIHDLFDVLTGPQNADEKVSYRCVFIYNTHATLTWEDVKVWLSATTPDGALFAIGVDPTSAAAVGASAAQAVEIADEETAPAGVAFSSPEEVDDAISLGNIGPGQVKALWMRRTATDSGPVNNDSFTLSIQGETEEEEGS